MQQVKLKGIILKEIPYGDSSKILYIVTDQFGLVSVMAKGAKGLKSKVREVSNKLVYANFLINYKPDGISTLVEGKIINSFKNIFNDYKIALYTFYIIDLAYQVLQENNDFNLFYLLESILLKLNDKLSPELLTSIFEIKILDYIGISINLKHCVMCGNNGTYLSLKNGGLLCNECFSNEYVYDKRMVNLLIVLNKCNVSSLKVLEIDDFNIYQELDNFLYDYISSYAGVYIRNKNNLKKMLQVLK